STALQAPPRTITSPPARPAAPPERPVAPPERPVAPPERPVAPPRRTGRESGSTADGDTDPGTGFADHPAGTGRPGRTAPVADPYAGPAKVVGRGAAAGETARFAAQGDDWAD